MTLNSAQSKQSSLAIIFRNALNIERPLLSNQAPAVGGRKQRGGSVTACASTGQRTHRTAGRARSGHSTGKAGRRAFGTGRRGRAAPGPRRRRPSPAARLRSAGSLCRRHGGRRKPTLTLRAVRFIVQSEIIFVTKNENIILSFLGRGGTKWD